MINGVVMGTVLDNVDPDGLNRILVRYRVDSGTELKSTWCRMMQPMAGKDRGLVMLPCIGTEVILAFAYKSMNPYLLGAVYNGAADNPKPYHNDDTNDDKRVFWSRNDHMVIFDDTPGAEKVELGAQAPTRLDVMSAPIYDSLDSAEMVINEYSEGDITWEAVETISIKCKDFKLEAKQNITMNAGMNGRIKAGNNGSITSGTNQTYFAPRTDINPGSPPPDPADALELPPYKHPPTK